MATTLKTVNKLLSTAQARTRAWMDEMSKDRQPVYLCGSCEHLAEEHEVALAREREVALAEKQGVAPSNRLHCPFCDETRLIQMSRKMADQIIFDVCFVRFRSEVQKRQAA